jgi:hypothetical protein
MKSTPANPAMFRSSFLGVIVARPFEPQQPERSSTQEFDNILQSYVANRMKMASASEPVVPGK